MPTPESPRRPFDQSQDPALLGGNITPNDEFLQRGIEELGESVTAALAIRGPKGPEEHLIALLEYADGSRAGERAVAFHWLATAQEAADRAAVVSSGAAAASTMRSTDSTLNKTLTSISEGGIDGTEAALTSFATGSGQAPDQAGMASATRRYHDQLYPLGTNAAGWYGNQAGRIAALGHHVEQADSQRLQLDETAAALLPGQDSELHDLTGLIDRKVVAAVGADIVALVQAPRESGQSLAQAMEARINSVYGLRAEEFQAVRILVQKYGGVVSRAGTVIRLVEDVGSRVTQLGGTAQTSDQAGLQIRLIQELVADGQASRQRTSEMLQASGEALKGI